MGYIELGNRFYLRGSHMKKGLKVLAAAGLSTMLLASAAIPTATLAKTPNTLEKFKNAPSFKAKKNHQEKKNPVSENSFIIKYKKPLSSAEHKAAGGTLSRQISKLNYAEIRVKDKKNLAKVMKTYQKLGKVESVSPSFLFTTSALADPKVSKQYQHSMLQTEKAQKLAGKNKVTVAVIDTGTDPNHPDLKNVLLPGYNAANPANQPITQYHGTHVSGIIAAAKGNGIGGYGIGQNVKILPIDVFDGSDGASDASIADGILYAVEKGAKVINMSLGGYGTSPVLEEAIKIANKKGVTVVAAAGNEGWDTVASPAGIEGVISVGSINSKKDLSWYSNFGPSVDIVAPGEDVYSTITDQNKATYANLSGTSMASPVVAGAVSLLLTKYPKLTPAQIEYVLEKTAADLGPKGFDTTYANGLVNLVGSLSYNVSKIPNYVKEEWTYKEILDKAEQVDASEKIVKEGAITKPFEQKWMKFDVKKGEHIQTLLEGSKNYDYKIMGHFFSEDNKVESFEVNQTQEGTSEAKLVKAPFDGTVTIGVKDVNGSFDDSGKKASAYKISVAKVAELPVDESSVDNMTKIPSLPYKLETPYTLVGETGDYDYFTFKVKEEQLVKIDMSAIPGLNTEIGVYNAASIFPEGENLKEEEKIALLKQLFEGEEKLEPEYYANNAGAGKSEILAFTAQPDQEYIIKVAGDAFDFDFLSFLFGLQLENEEKPSSLLPYTLNVVSKVLPADEDGLNQEVFGVEPTEEEFFNGFGNEKQSAFKAAAIDPYFEEQNRIIQLMLEKGRSYAIGDKVDGYVQNASDMDLFVVDAKETAIYEFGFTNKEGNIPYVEVSEVTEGKDEEGNSILSLSYLGDNSDWSGMDIKMKEQFFTGFQKGKKYIVSIAANPFTETSAVSFEPYEMTSKKLLSNPEDKYEPNDLLNVKNLPSTKFQANLAMPGDIDVFYYQAKDTGIKAITLEAGNATEEMKKKYPADLVSGLHAMAVVIEDTNKNRKFDLSDREVTTISKGPLGFTSGSFKVQKGKNYFFGVEGLTDGSLPFSLVPYTFNLLSMNKKDESTAQKPVKMKKESNSLHSAKGYFNAGITAGDTDYYDFELGKDAAVSLKLEAGKEADGVIDIYQNGKLIKHSNSYMQDDTEEIQLNMKKGKYQVRVKDANGVSSLTPYTLKVQLK